MRFRFFAALLLALLFHAPASADTVYLANGRTFEGVIAEVGDSEVKIRMAGGSLSLPKSHVARVEPSDSDLAAYLRRKEALRRNGEAKAADWLALARWARSEGLAHGVREAALIAADLDPHLEGLAPLLRGHGYVLDEQLDRWVPYNDYMRRRGFVLSGGQWITREENAARVRAQEEEAARSRADRAAARAAQATQAVREVELELARLELRDRVRREEQPPAYYGGGMPVYVYPGFWPPFPVPVPPCHGHGCGGNQPEPPGPPHHRPPHRTIRDDGRGSYTHVPGSLIPGRLAPISKHGGG